MKFKLALIQMEVVGGGKERNLDRAERLIGQAAAGGAEAVLLPEAMNLGWTHASAADRADPIPDGRTCALLRDTARSHRLYICSGLVERNGDEIFNSAVLIDPQGRVLLHARKLNELDIAHSCYAQGDRLGVAPTPLGKLGIMICSDGFAKGQVIGRTLGYMGADVILSPCAWAVPADHDNKREPYGKLWRDNYVPVATDFRLWIAAASNVGCIDEGAWSGWKCIGCSLVIDPQGREVVQGPYGDQAESILFVEIEPRRRPARGTDWPKLWSTADDHRKL